MIINTKNLDTLRVIFNSQFNSAFEQVTPTWSQVAMAATSTAKANVYGWLGQIPSLKEWLDERTINNLVSHDFTIKNRKFESTVKVRAEDIEDDILGEYGPMFSMLGDSAARHPDEMVYSLLSTAFTGLCYDGQFFIDTDHPVTDINGVSQSVSNSMGGSGSPWFLLDASRPIKPLIWQSRRPYRFRAQDDPNNPVVFNKDEFTYGVDCRVNAGFGLWQFITGSKQALNADNFALADQNLISRTGDNGVKLNLKSSLLVVGPSSKQAALNTIATERLASGASNPYYKAVDILVTPYLS